MSSIPLQLLLLLKFKSSYLCPVGASSSSLLSPLDMTPAIFNNFLAIWIDKMFQDPFVHFLTLTWNQLLLPELWFLLAGNGYFKTTMWVLGILLVPGPLYVYLQVPTHLPVCVYAMLERILLLRDKEDDRITTAHNYLIYPILNLYQHQNNNTTTTNMIPGDTLSAYAPRSTSPFFHILYSPLLTSILIL